MLNQRKNKLFHEGRQCIITGDPVAKVKNEYDNFFLRILTGGRLASWLCTSVVEELKLGRLLYCKSSWLPER